MMVSREPVGEIEDQPGKEPGLGDAQQKPHGAEARRPADRGGEPGQDPPGDHDAGDPQPRADLLHDQVTRQLENRVAPIKCAERKAKGGSRHPEIIAHGQPGEADVDAVDIGQQIAQHRQR